MLFSHVSASALYERRERRRSCVLPSSLGTSFSLTTPNEVSRTWDLSAVMLSSALLAHCSASVGDLAGAGKSLLVFLGAARRKQHCVGGIQRG